MSEALDDAALEAAAEAAIAEAQGEKPEAAAEAPAKAETPKDTDPRAKINDTAAKIGWSGKEDWKGDPADWLDAPEFILKAAGEVLPSMRKSLEDAKTE